MPPKNKNKPPVKKIVKTPRAGSSKKKRVADKAWTAHVKVETKGTPDDSRSSTPAYVDNDNKQSQNTSTASRDFIRQVLQFDKASDSELDSSEDGSDSGDEIRTSDAELKKAIRYSLADAGEESDNDSIGLEIGRNVGATVVSGDPEMDSVSDSNASFLFSEQPSVYAPMPEEIPSDMPKLELPPCSEDLLISKELVLKAAGVYEILRMFSQIIRLSPFLFEEFLVAVGGNKSLDHGPLLHEIHCSLIKTVLRDEENNQTSFGPIDLKDSVNSLFFFNDAMTYPHAIKEYLLSDPDKEYKVGLPSISKSAYPIESAADILSVLETLCNILLASNCIREELSSDGIINHDQVCRVCQK